MEGKNKVTETPASPEEHKRDCVLVFDSVKVCLATDNDEVTAFCEDYFETYAEKGDRGTKRDSEWTIVEEVDDSKKEERSWFVDEKGKKIIISAAKSDKRFVMRVIRSLVMLEDMACGGIMFKGAAFINRNGKGIVLMGAKRAGKTSAVLSYMLENYPQSRFITNSHVSLALEDGLPVARGYPMSVGVRINVLEAIQRRGNDNIKPLVNMLRGDMEPGDDNRYYLDPNVLRKIFQNRIKDKTRVEAVVLVKSTSTKSSSSIRKLSVEEVEQFLREYHERYLNRENSGWFELFQVPNGVQTDSVKAILEKCELYELTYNVGGHKQAIKLINEI